MLEKRLKTLERSWAQKFYEVRTSAPARSRMTGPVSRQAYDNVVLVKRDAVTGDEAFDGKIKNLVYNSVSMEWEAQLPATVSGGGLGDASAANQATQITAANSTNTKLDSLLTELQNKADLTETQPVSVSGGATSAKQDTGNTSVASIDTKTPALGQATMANSTPVTLASNQTSIPVAATLAAETTKVIGTVNQGTSPWVISLGNSTGKTNVLKTGTLATSAATADQVILTYTVTSGKTFYLEYFDIVARLTTFAATATNFGNVSLESPAGTKLYTSNVFHAGDMDPRGVFFSEPIPIAAGVVIRIVCTPSTVTAMTWTGNMGGYEK